MAAKAYLHRNERVCWIALIIIYLRLVDRASTGHPGTFANPLCRFGDPGPDHRRLLGGGVHGGAIPYDLA